MPSYYNESDSNQDLILIKIHTFLSHENNNKMIDSYFC